MLIKNSGIPKTNGTVGDKVLILSTNKLSKIKQITSVLNITIEFDTKEESNKFKELLNYEYPKQKYTADSVSYQLYNGNEYSEKDLIIGSDNIREFKLKSIL